MTSTIVCGCGRVGERLATHLSNHGEEVTVLERDHTIIESLRDQRKFSFFEGDAANPDVLKAAGVAKARWIAAVTGDDKANMIICTEAKNMNKGIKVAVRVSSQEDLDVFMKLGVDLMVFPEIVAGLQLAEAVLEKVDPEHLATVASQEEVHKRPHKFFGFF
jgi:Trk K+ transport system NAD-binding subunit